MDIEYEATFQNISKEEARQRLQSVGATLVRPEFLQRRVVLDPVPEYEKVDAFLRVRDEGNKITLTYKMTGKTITDQKEIELIVDNFEATVALLLQIGCVERSYEESKRELWHVDGTEIMLDEWPFLGSIVEIEGTSEKNVKEVAQKLGFNWEDARFCNKGTLYVEKYGLGPIDVAKKTGVPTKLTFEGKNPFI